MVPLYNLGRLAYLNRFDLAFYGSSEELLFDEFAKSEYF